MTKTQTKSLEKEKFVEIIGDLKVEKERDKVEKNHKEIPIKEIAVGKSNDAFYDNDEKRRKLSIALARLITCDEVCGCVFFSSIDEKGKRKKSINAEKSFTFLWSTNKNGKGGEKIIAALRDFIRTEIDKKHNQFKDQKKKFFWRCAVAHSIKCNEDGSFEKKISKLKFGPGKKICEIFEKFKLKLKDSVGSSKEVSSIKDCSDIIQEYKLAINTYNSENTVSKLGESYFKPFLDVYEAYLVISIVESREKGFLNLLESIVSKNKLVSNRKKKFFIVESKENILHAEMKILEYWINHNYTKENGQKIFIQCITEMLSQDCCFATSKKLCLLCRIVMNSSNEVVSKYEENLKKDLFKKLGGNTGFFPGWSSIRIPKEDITEKVKAESIKLLESMVHDKNIWRLEHSFIENSNFLMEFGINSK